MLKIVLLAQLLELGKAPLHGAPLAGGHIFGTATAGGIQSTLAVVGDHVAEGLLLEGFLALFCRERVLAGVGQDDGR